MATVANEEFATEWRTVGLARIVNASSMAGRVSHQHWFATVARHLLQPDGPNFVVTYAQMNIVFWTVGDFGDGTVVDGKWSETGVELQFIQDVVSACLRAQTISKSVTAHTWAHDFAATQGNIQLHHH